MSGSRTVVKNLLLAVGSILFAFLLSIAADRLVGVVAPDPALPGTMELIFPPNAEHSYTSVDFDYTVRINSLGLRDREIPKEPTKSYRIIAIGDSYTYGWGVAIEQTWLRLLEQRLQAAGLDVETVNLGKPGAGPPLYADLAERAVPILRPDLVLVPMVQGNDLAAAGPEGLEETEQTIADKVRVVYPNILRLLEDRRRTRDYATRTQEVMPPQKTSAENNRRWAANTAKSFLEKMSPEHRARFDAFEAVVKEAFLDGRLNPYMIDLAMQNPQFLSVTLDPDNPWTQECIERMAGQLARIKDVAQAYGARVIVLSIPEGPYVNDHAFKNIQRVGFELSQELLMSDGPDRGIQRACELAGLPFIHVTRAFKDRRSDPGLYYELDGHLTPEGHELCADALAPALIEAIGAEAKRK